VDLTRPVALVVGSEGAGLDEELLGAVSARVAIPMAGGVESLNVAVAAGILLFEAARQRRR
jgi:tRNA G18 (ribose-2'-O)-methylase SpoU